MEDEVRTMICQRCRKTVPITNVKYLPKGKDGESRMAICTTCLASNPMQKESSKPASSSVTIDDRPQYYCERCKYKFKYNTRGPSNLRCPFCGKADKVSEAKIQTASNLLNMS